VLEAATRRLDTNDRLKLARSVEETAAKQLDLRYPNRQLRANVEFNTAVLLEAIGLPRALYTATFAVGRIIGWLAHIEEQRRKGRLIRPTSKYIGSLPSAS